MKYRFGEDIGRLGPEKIVATQPTSFTLPKFYIDNWLVLDEMDRYFITKICYPKFFNSEFGVFINDNLNKIIYYLVKYIELLGKASNKTIEELLIIFSKIQQINSLNMDLIYIGFGDVLGNNTWGKQELKTEEGKLVLEKYLSLLEKVEQVENKNLYKL